MAQVGDMVRFLNSVGGGRIVRIDGQMAYVDEDGFETPVLLRECVVVGTAQTEKSMREAPAVAKKASAPVPSKEIPAVSAMPQNEEAPEEVAGGDKLNIVLGYEPADIKRISSTKFDTYLVNDSNYYLYFTYLSRDDSGRWTTRYAGIVEPNIQLFLEELERDDLASMERIAVQCVAFKRGREFELKQPVSVDIKFDATRFFKLHSFRPNDYFDNDVIAYQIVKDDEPLRKLELSSKSIEQAIREKEQPERSKTRPVVKKKRRGETGAGGVIEVDLHIGELVDTTAGLSNADMLNLQVDEFRRVMDENLRKKGQKIVFIHGKGEGVLREALMKELRHRYKGHDVQDASFREYGFGATQVTIR